MPHPRAFLILLGLSASVLASAKDAGALATYNLDRDSVIPVVIENNLTLDRLEEGDRFTAHVDNDRDLPIRTRFIGRVSRIRERRRDRSVSVDLAFTDVILPDGSRHRIDALPVSLDDKFVTRRDDGRIVVRDDVRRRDDYVVGGAIGGFIIGSMFHRRVTGTIIGAVVGAIAAHNERREDETILRTGQKVGALIERDTRLESYPENHRSDDRYHRFDNIGGDGNPPARTNDDRRGDDQRGDDQRGDDRSTDDRRGDAPPKVDPNKPIVLAYAGKNLKFDSAKPFLQGEVVMVPLQRTAIQLGLSVDRGKDKVVYVEGEDSSLRLEQDSTDARLNGHRVTLSASLIDKDGVLYVPVEILASMKKEDFLVNGNRIKTESSDQT